MKDEDTEIIYHYIDSDSTKENHNFIKRTFVNTEHIRFFLMKENIIISTDDVKKIVKKNLVYMSGKHIKAGLYAMFL